MKKYLSFLTILFFLVLIVPTVKANDLSMRDFLSMLINTGVITSDKIPAINAYLEKNNEPIIIVENYSDNKIKKTYTKENLTISEIKISLPNGTDFGNLGNVFDQKIRVTIKNDQFGSLNLTGKEVDYSIYLYDVTFGSKKIFKAATGKVLVPYANGYSEFEAYIEGGLPFDGKNFEKKYKALVKIDTSKKIKESNEKDNESWSDEWLITYYKG